MYADSKGWVRLRSQAEEELRCKRSSSKWNVTRPG